MSTVGILGGGQLARMLALAGAPLGVRFLVVDNLPEACASQVAQTKTSAASAGTLPKGAKRTAHRRVGMRSRPSAT